MTKKTILSIYRTLLKESLKFKDYNFRNYSVRRTRDVSHK